jgi:hypothetical protein
MGAAKELLIKAVQGQLMRAEKELLIKNISGAADEGS